MRFPQSQIRRCAVICALPLMAASPAVADPTLGVGLTITFGGGQPQVGAGVRVFSDDDEDEFAATVGLDYVFTSQSWRGSVGGAYMMNNSYIGLDGGYNFGSGTFDVGIGGGWADTHDGGGDRDYGENADGGNSDGNDGGDGGDGEEVSGNTGGTSDDGFYGGGDDTGTDSSGGGGDGATDGRGGGED